MARGEGAHARLRRWVDRLARHYGEPEAPALTDPFDLVLWVNVAYLASDEKRETVYRTFVKKIGPGAEDILAASAEALHEVARLGGMRPEDRVAKLLRIAELVMDEHDGDLSRVLDLPPAQAVRCLKKFPGIGEPGAEKILLFSRRHPVLAPESNGLRVLLRLGLVPEEKSYAGSYRAVRKALAASPPPSCEVLIRAHQLLRRHGQELCRHKAPSCELCPLRDRCAFAATG